MEPKFSDTKSIAKQQMAGHWLSYQLKLMFTTMRLFKREVILTVKHRLSVALC